MSSLPRYVVVLALSFSCAIFNTAANSQTKTAQKAPTSTVAGRITIHGKGAAGIVIGIRSSDFSQQPAPALKATTDADGNYQITDIPAGSYQVWPLAPVYTFADSLVSRARAKTLLLAEGEEVQGIDFSLVRGGVIAGKVTDADGRPVVEERLTLVPVYQENQPSQIMASGSGFQTDDRGMYRIYGLAAGRYKIFVGVAEDNPSPPMGFGRASYRRTFHPDATDPDDAKVVEISEGAEATNIDITVGRSLPAFSASGKIVDGETTQPLTGLRMGLQRVNNNNSPIMMGPYSATNGLGEFRLENLTPGKYSVFILPQPGTEVRADAMTFEIVDQDVTGLLVKTTKGLTITGTVVVDGTFDKSVMEKLTQLRLSVFVRSESESSVFSQESPINLDGSFRVGGLAPGIASFSLRDPGHRLINFAVLRAERDGIVLPRGVEIKAGEQVTGVKIIVSYGTGSIRGEVKLENGPLPPNGRIVVWIKKPGDTNPYYRPYNLDSRGHFLIEGVPAGSYELNVNGNIPGRRAPPSVKQPIEVADGTVSDVVVTLDLKPNPGQPPIP
jgi:hypothetical protein